MGTMWQCEGDAQAPLGLPELYSDILPGMQRYSFTVFEEKVIKAHNTLTAEHQTADSHS